MIAHHPAQVEKAASGGWEGKAGISGTSLLCNVSSLLRALEQRVVISALSLNAG